METSEPEPWLRGPLPGVPPHLAPIFFSFAQVEEDLSRYIQGISQSQLWQPIVDKHTLGFHLKHIAGSVNRLVTYLMGEQLSSAQLEYLRQEHKPDINLTDLREFIHETFDTAQSRLLAIAPESLSEARVVGRKALPTTVLGLLVHICEHTQRHLGQVILICRLLRQS